MTDYARLRALAEAAGPFVRYELNDPNPNFIFGSDPGDDSSQIVIGDVYDDRVADYIAAIDPPTLIALLDRLEELEALRDGRGLSNEITRNSFTGEWFEHWVTPWEPVTGDDDA